MEAVTENEIEHILREVKKKFSNPNKKVTPKLLARVAQEITIKMKHLRMKRMKDKKSKKKSKETKLKKHENKTAHHFMPV